ncbi:MAG TPA: hypothetical protein VJ964_06985 [Balneolaceae bacterium]|nr:hypothetical protein [Balneolaceae bacterium]
MTNTDFHLMKRRRTYAVLGIFLLISGFYIMKQPVYTSVKKLVFYFSSNVGLSVAAVLGLVALTFTTAVVLLRKA